MLRDDQWARIEQLLPGKATDRGVTAKDNRRFVEAVLVLDALGLGLFSASGASVGLPMAQLAWRKHMTLEGRPALSLPDVPVVDVFIIAAGFMLRLLAGTLIWILATIAIATRMSHCLRSSPALRAATSAWIAACAPANG